MSSTPDPNAEQRRLIDSTEGIYRVDAGAGTGKTFTVTRRYANIVDQPAVEPEDLLLVTFTRNAASEMRERIVANSEYGARELRDAPIQTFHSYCHDLLQEFGHDAPQELGIDDRITGSTRIVDDDIVEEALFSQFITQFTDAHPEHHEFLQVVQSPTALLGVINELASKGVFPTADGWYRNGERFLTGDFEAFQALFDEANQAQGGGSRQSELRASLSRFGEKCYLPDAPAKDVLRGARGTKEIPRDVARQVFYEDRTRLTQFAHDVFFEYVEFALSRNYLTFGFLQLFAFVLLCERPAIREEVAFDYVMVDEFQDSSEIQFKLALLLAGTDNLCVVGDWKQSIYSFQYAAVENITAFESRLARFVEELNEGTERVAFDPAVAPVTDIELVENYRSTQALLDFSEHALTVPAAKKDDVDADAVLDDVVSLSSNATHENSRLDAVSHTDEEEAVLSRIQEIVGNDDYAIEDDGELRVPTYGDIAVLTRTHDFGRDLLNVAEAYDFPIAYQGGVELFRTDQAKLVLAWLRILERDADRGWAVVLEEAGYTFDEIEAILSGDEHSPEEMQAFRSTLAALDGVGSVVRRILQRYGYHGPYADVLLGTLQSIHETSTFTRGDLIRFIEQGIERGSTHEVETKAGADSVTLQTIHAAKGLEYPIVILANMNSRRFPPSGGGNDRIRYQDPVGLRQTKLGSDTHGLPHVYDNWRTDVIRKCLPDGYDEERRLLYVAITRAKSHVVFTAGDEPNSFLEELPVAIEDADPAVEAASATEEAEAPLTVEMPDEAGPQRATPHTLMDDGVFEDVDEGRGTEFGTAVHDFAEAYVRGDAVEPSNDDERNVRAFLDSLGGDLLTEEEAFLPLTVAGERVIVSGVIDLLCVTPDSVSIVDFKTDLGRHAESEYQTQLSVYAHVVAAAYPEREVSASIFYTASGERCAVEVRSLQALEELVSKTVTAEA